MEDYNLMIIIQNSFLFQCITAINHFYRCSVTIPENVIGHDQMSSIYILYCSEIFSLFMGERSELQLSIDFCFCFKNENLFYNFFAFPILCGRQYLL